MNRRDFLRSATRTLLASLIPWRLLRGADHFDSSLTTITVDSSSSWWIPPNRWNIIWVDSEQMRVIGIDGKTLTVQRA